MKKDADRFTDAEAQRRFEAALRGAHVVGHKPQSEMKIGKSKAVPKRPARLAGVTSKREVTISMHLSWTGCRLLLRLIEHVQRVVEGIAQKSRSGGTAAQSASCNKFHSYICPTYWRQNAASQFDLDGSVYCAVSTYDIEVNKGGCVGVSVGWCGGRSVFGRAHNCLPKSRFSRLPVTHSNRLLAFLLFAPTHEAFSGPLVLRALGLLAAINPSAAGRAFD
jgi:hypothetical protein